jgi:hypothetical protein
MNKLKLKISGWLVAAGGALIGGHRFSSLSETIRVILVITGACLVLIALAVAVSAGRSRLSDLAAWLRIASRRGSRVRTRLFKVLADVVFVGVSLILALALVSPNLLGLGWVGVGIIFVWWLSYRRHRRREHNREAATIRVLPKLFQLVDRADRFSASGSDELKAFIRQLVDELRLILDAMHEPDHGGVVIWVYAPSRTEGVLNCWAVSHSVAHSVPAEAFDCSLHALLSSGKDRIKITWGSIAGYSLARTATWKDPYPEPQLLDTATDCRACDYSYLEQLQQDDQKKFMAGSVLVTNLRAIDDDASWAFAGGWLLPIIAIHPKPLWFTGLDRLTFWHATEALSRLIRRNRSVLPPEWRLARGERSVLIAALRDDVEELDDASIGAAQATFGLSDREARFSVESPTIQAGRKRAKDFEEAPLVRVDVLDKSGLAHASGSRWAKDQLDYLSHGGHPSFDLLGDLYLSRQLALLEDSGRTNGQQTPAIVDGTLCNHILDGVDRDARRSEVVDELLRTVAERRPGSIYVLPRRPVASRDALKRAVSHLTRLGWKPCLDATTSEAGAKLAEEVGATWIRIPRDYVATRAGDPAQVAGFETLIKAATTRNLGVIACGNPSTARFQVDGVYWEVAR